VVARDLSRRHDAPGPDLAARTVAESAEWLTAAHADSPHSPADRRLEYAMTELRSKLDEAELAAAWKTGGAWSSNEAIDYALSLGSVLSRDC
jgi:hypothetical protein